MKHEARDMLSLDWYETGLSSGERKQRGHFSTPHALIDQILDACGYVPSADLRHVRVLDPACGSGNFLARAALRLHQSLAARGLSQREIGTCAQEHLWGLDPDPVACFLAEMQVRSALGELCDVPAFHIHQADSLALSWQACADLLLANPPYLAAKNTDLSHYSQAQRRGQADSYLLFLELALRVVRPGGWIGLVLPDPVLARANAVPERASLLRVCTIQHIWHLSGVFAADVGAVVIVARKTSPSALHRVYWTRERWRLRERPGEVGISAQRVGQVLLASQPGAELRYLLGSADGQVSERLRRALPNSSHDLPLLPLEALVNIKRGEELGRASDLLRPLATCKDGFPVLRGGIDLRPYALFPPGLGIDATALKKPVERYLQPKLLVVKSTERLQAALDIHGHAVLQTLYLLQMRVNTGNHSSLAESELAPKSAHNENAEDYSLVPKFGVSAKSPLLEGMGQEELLESYYFLLALLNSRLLGAYVYHLHTAYKLVQPQIEQAVLARLPIAWGSADERGEIAQRSKALAQACSQAGPVVEWEEHLRFLYEEQERAIRALYAASTGIFADKGVAKHG